VVAALQFARLMIIVTDIAFFKFASRTADAVAIVFSRGAATKLHFAALTFTFIRLAFHGIVFAIRILDLIIRLHWRDNELTIHACEIARCLRRRAAGRESARFEGIS